MLPITKKRFWTQIELELIKNQYEHTSPMVLATQLKRPIGSVYQAAAKLGLKRDKSYLVALAKNLAEAGKANRFKKGQKPPNTGKKQTEYMSAKSIEKTLATRFKKGQKPHNTKPTDGVISLRKDNSGHTYQYIRVAMGKWELLHRVIWQQHNGAIPPNMVIIFKDGNHFNCCISNLELLTKQQHLERNQDKHNGYDEATKTAIKLINKIHKKVKNYAKEQQQQLS